MGAGCHYNVSPDGRRFLTLLTEEDAVETRTFTEIALVENWVAEADLAV